MEGAENWKKFRRLKNAKFRVITLHRVTFIVPLVEAITRRFSTYLFASKRLKFPFVYKINGLLRGEIIIPVILFYRRRRWKTSKQNAPLTDTTTVDLAK